MDKQRGKIVIYVTDQRLYEAHPGDDYDKIKAEAKKPLDAVV